MDLGNLRLFHLMKERMDWQGQKQKVTAQNVANADTPDYFAHDLAAFNAQKAITRANNPSMGMHSTRANHLEGTISGAAMKEREAKSVYDISPTKNAVTLEEEMLKMSDNAEQYRLTSQVYKKYSNLFKIAIRGSGGG
jgi:flagellar basal-body rod protein FlgB